MKIGVIARWALVFSGVATAIFLCAFLEPRGLGWAVHWYRAACCVLAFVMGAVATRLWKQIE